MIRKEAIKLLSDHIKDDPIVSANGFISRDLFEVSDKPSNFYMIGSMGLASSIGLGIAIKNPKKRIFVFDGDGNILMNLGSLTTIGSIKPTNFVHIILDNKSHESTGGQPTNTQTIKIERIAKSSNYNIFTTNSKNRLVKILNDIKNKKGLFLIVIKIKKSNYASKRINLKPQHIKKRFMNYLNRNNK